MRLLCITHHDLVATNKVIAAACQARGIECVAIDSGALEWPYPFAEPFDMMVRPATSLAADRLFRLLWQPNIATFCNDPFFECYGQALYLQRMGIAMPRTLHIRPHTAPDLARAAAALGGFPLVAKVGGAEGGVGVIRVDSLEALISLCDYLPTAAVLMEYFDHRIAYRLVVVGNRVVATEARHPGAFDFRSNASGGNLGAVRPPRGAVALALTAARLLKQEFGGADVLAADDGRLVLAEFNSPCYFADQQRDSGIDIAGAMLDYLVAKRRRLLRRARGIVNARKSLGG
jgi:hypothetical protein